MATMEVETGDEILRKVAVDGSMDYSQWPSLLPLIVSRIEKIAYNDFPVPHIPQPPPRAWPSSPPPRFLDRLPSSDPVAGPDSSASDTAHSEENNKENAIPNSSPAAARATPAPGPSSTSSTLHHSSPPRPSSRDTPLPSTQQPSQSQPPEPGLPPGALPTPVVALLNEVTSTLSQNFTTYPPHTVQRLSELVLRPRQHYRSVVSYLHALDRVVHVTSGANVYPLPPAIPDMSAMSLLANGVGGAGPGNGLSINTSTNPTPGSDEALGGALLTPIPWLARRTNGASAPTEDTSSDAGSASPLSAGSGGGPSRQQPNPSSARNVDPQIRTESTETIEGPNGMGSIETVSISVNGIPSTGAGHRGVTQGELLRQEQRAGVVPLSQLARHNHPITTSTPAQQASADEDSSMTEADNEPSSSGPESTPPTEKAEEEEEEEIPHARGPEEIGAADTGPQPPGTGSYVVSADGSVEMRGIDVEAAVGRKASSPNPEGEDAVARSPKREAEDTLQGEIKRLKEEDQEMKDGEGDAVISNTASTATTTPTPTEDTKKEEQEPKKKEQKEDTESGTTKGG